MKGSKAASSITSLDEPSLSNAGLWLRQSDETGNQIIIHAGKLASPNLVLDNVTLFFFNDLTQFTSRIDARTAQLETGDWLIEDGMRWLPDQPPQPLARWRLPTQLTPHKIEESFASPDTMSFWELPSFIALLEQSGFPAQRHRLHYNVLLARPFLLCAMVLVAAIFSLRMQRRGGAIAMIVGGVVAGFLLYVLSDVVFALGISAKVPGCARRLDPDRDQPDLRRLDAAPSGRRLMGRSRRLDRHRLPPIRPRGSDSPTRCLAVLPWRSRQFRPPPNSR